MTAATVSAAVAWPLALHAQGTANVTIATEPQVEVARVKSAESMLPKPRLSDRLVDLTKGLSLSGAEGIGSDRVSGTWAFTKRVSPLRHWGVLS
jgi:hypothetical protein